MFPTSSAKIGTRPRVRIRLLSFWLLTGVVASSFTPGCLAVDSMNQGLSGSLANHTAGDAYQTAAHLAPREIRDHLRSALRPIFELSLLLLCGLGAAALVALRCRRTERARLSNLRQLRLLGGSEEHAFPARLIAELRGVLARIGGRSELMLERSSQIGLNSASADEQTNSITAGLSDDADSMRSILQACRRLEASGPALKIGRRTPVDLGALLARLSNVPCPPGPLVNSDPELLEIAFALLLRLAQLDTNSSAAISVQTAPASRADSAAATGSPAETRSDATQALVIIHSTINHTLLGQDAGIEVSRRLLLGLGAKLQVTTEHSQGSAFEVELPL